MSLLDEANGYFEDIRMKYKGEDEIGGFIFNNERVNNSPYVIVTGKNHK